MYDLCYSRAPETFAFQRVHPVTRTESQRAQPRVEYAAEVHILRPGGRSPIKARSLNLSPTGVFVEAELATATDCDVGTKLLCDIPLPGGRRYLKGTVARRQPMASHGTGLGIRFENLEAADQAILHALVQNGADHSRLVKVRFEGMPEALRSRAVVTKEGLRLQTALPFLRLSSGVGVSFIAGDSRIETHGTLEKVHLEPEPSDGIPRLAVDVALPEPMAGEFAAENTPTTGEYGPDEPAAGALADHTPARTEPPPGPKLRAPAGPTTPTLVLHKTAQAMAPDEITPGPGRPLRRKAPIRIRERRAMPPPQTPVASRSGETLPPPPEFVPHHPGRRRSPTNPWWWVWGWPALGTVLLAAVIYDRVVVASRVDSHLQHQGVAIEQTRQAVVEASAMARQAKGAAEATQAATLGLRGAIRREVSAALAGQDRSPKAARRAASEAEAAAERPMPNLAVQGKTAVASVPITGTTDRMIHYSLKDPSGVVVKLPNARALLPDGHYWLREGGFKVVWVEQRREGLVLRFVYDHSLTRQELLEVVEAGPEAPAPPGDLNGSVRVRLRKI